jgi:multimeric flavodoxin WrbA
MKKVVAIQGSYRKGKVTDSAVDAVLKGAESVGAQTEKIYLIDQHIEFCNNCRTCCQKPGPQRGTCIYQDDMEAILNKIDQADAIIICSPMNAGFVTAITKRFIERMLVYFYWPWGKVCPPKRRNKQLTKKAVIVSASTMPAFLGRLLGRHVFKMLHGIAKTLGGRVVGTLYFGMVAPTPDWKLPQKQLQKCFQAGVSLVQ